MHTSIVLTVAESKRLIAKSLSKHPAVRHALSEGIIAVAPGTTNGYLVEELTGKPFAKEQFVTGRTLPVGYKGAAPTYKEPDLVLEKGKALSISAVKALPKMGPGDVFIKGANALNYELKQAGVLIGHPTGGTLGAIMGTIIAKRIHLLHPVGLEKTIPGNLHEMASLLEEADGSGPTLWVTPGEIFTELEALEQIEGIAARPLAAGGIGGAEGGLWITLFGTRKALDKALKLVDSVRGEAPFLAAENG
jgi:hypothetical protein